jgi:hypothetical protein
MVRICVGSGFETRVGVRVRIDYLDKKKDSIQD